ncbi:DUF2946 domain-containing protein [Mangrovibacter sp. MFB070]|uniref:DUF2946 domain-containing protein n=1 Tax=Mangrovibacter sp. MFB070 TaxID=1224318 RepID=UPI0005601B84|nr:DUF2946 domain-containing protein [Mangrovibacter sp. MFB070]
MLHYFHARVGRVGIFLALLAIFMLFVAPVVSKTLVRQGLMTPEMGDMLMPGMAMMQHEPQMMQHEPAMAHEQAGEQHGMHHASSGENTAYHEVVHNSTTTPQVNWMDDAACGYCQLLLHMPLIFWVAALLLWCLITLRRTPAVVLVCVPAFRGWFRPFLARAPPVLVIH